MDGKFDENLTLSPDGKGVEVSGPIDSWGDDELDVTIDVSIEQNGVAAVGRTDEILRGASRFEVAAAVKGDGMLEPGPATATGQAHVRSSTGTLDYEWTVDVTLWDSSPAANPANPPEAPAIVG